jgi:hypothetical protein
LLSLQRRASREAVTLLVIKITIHSTSKFSRAIIGIEWAMQKPFDLTNNDFDSMFSSHVDKTFHATNATLK